MVQFPETERLSVLSWNLAYMKPGRFKGRVNRARQWAFIAACAPDVVLLQECRMKDLSEALAAGLFAGHDVVGVPHARVGSAIVLARRELGLRALDRTSVGDDARRLLDALGIYVAAGTVTIGGHQVTVASVHALADVVPDRKLSAEDHARLRRPSKDAARFNDLAAAALEGVGAERFLFGGDWNTARAFDQTVPKEAPGAAEFFEGRERAGWRDAMRATHAEEVRTYNQPGSHPYELDHVFVDATTFGNVVAADPVSGFPADGLSDHLPVFVSLSL